MSQQLEDYSECYAQALEETIIVRRYTGSGQNRPRFDVEARGRATGYEAKELVGPIVQGDQKVIILIADLVAAQMALPLTSADKVIVRGRELAIIAPALRKSPDGSLIAYEIQARG